MRERTQRAQESVPMAPWKSIKPSAGQDQTRFSPSSKAFIVSIFLTSQWDRGPAWPLEKNTHKSGLLLLRGRRKVRALRFSILFGKKPRCLAFHLLSCQAAHQELNLRDFLWLKSKALTISFYLSLEHSFVSVLISQMCVLCPVLYVLNPFSFLASFPAIGQPGSEKQTLETHSEI